MLQSKGKKKDGNRHNFRYMRGYRLAMEFHYHAIYALQYSYFRLIDLNSNSGYHYLKGKVIQCIEIKLTILKIG